MRQYESATPQPFYSLVFLESGGSGGDEHLDHSNHSKPWCPQKVVVEHRLPPVLTCNNLCETWFEILREKCCENFAKIFGALTPFFTQPKRRIFSHEIPLSFPQGFPHSSPRCFRGWETTRLPLTKAYPNQYSPDKGVVPENLCL